MSRLYVRVLTLLVPSVADVSSITRKDINYAFCIPMTIVVIFLSSDAEGGGVNLILMARPHLVLSHPIVTYFSPFFISAKAPPSIEPRHGIHRQALNTRSTIILPQWRRTSHWFLVSPYRMSRAMTNLITLALLFYIQKTMLIHPIYTYKSNAVSP